MRKLHGITSWLNTLGAHYLSVNPLKPWRSARSRHESANDDRGVPCDRFAQGTALLWKPGPASAENRGEFGDFSPPPVRNSPFSAATERILMSLAEAFAPSDVSWPDAAETSVRYVRNVARAFGPEVRRMVVNGVWLLELLPLSSGKQRLSRLSPARRRQLLEKWEQSPLVAARMIIARMRGLCLMGTYADRGVRDEIGYHPRFETPDGGQRRET